MERETKHNSNNNTLNIAIISAVGGYLAGSSSKQTSVVQPPDNVNVSNYSFPDIWKAVFVEADPTLEELGALYGYVFFYRPLAELLKNLEFGSSLFSQPQARRIIKEMFDRYQCRLIGLKTGLNLQGFHSVLDVPSGQSNTRVCLIDHYQSNSSTGFLASQDFGSVLLDNATIRCPKRNAQRQFYLFERLKSFLSVDFDILKTTGSFDFDSEDSFMLRKLGAFMASNFGRQAVLNDPRGASILALFDSINIFATNDARGCYVYLKRDASIVKYSQLINNLTTIIYG